ncbi:nucleotide sugar dehydrogenase [Candidatus Woesearchaeota archaeon]|nr:nucleotide sugar dehydrogenase [Candidatus Woesearchaeota archaeon]
MASVTIVGLGYVGLPLACLCAEKGMDVYGIDINKNKVDQINKGISPINDPDLIEEVRKSKGKIKAADNFQAIKNSSVVIVCVPTPVDDRHLPDLKPLKDACISISGHLKENTLVVIESTIYPGTTEEIVLPILKKSDVVFYLAHCPERIVPGNKKWTVKNLPRVVAGIDKKSTEKAYEFYKKIIDADITKLSSAKAAEAAKIMENTFRDVNIAFINEMAMSFDKAGIDILEIIKGASTKPFAFMAHYPGVGVGGHCIPVDPYYLIEKAKQIGFNHRFLSLAREINNNMPHYTVQLLEEELKKLKKGIKGAKVGVLGLAYKADVDDMRESPALKVIEVLKEKQAEVLVFDPYIREKSDVKELSTLLGKVEYIILAADHSMFRNIDIGKLKENNIKIVIDGRNCLNKEKIKKIGIAYRGIGQR